MPDTGFEEEDIKELVKEYTAGDNSEGVELTGVEILKEMKDDSDKIISKCWKVTFPDADKEVMMQESSWPAGWTFRRYFPSRQQRQPREVPLYKPVGVNRP